MAPKLNYVKFCVGIIILLVLYILYLLYKQKRVENFADTANSLPDYIVAMQSAITSALIQSYGITANAISNVPRPESVEYIVKKLRTSFTNLLEYFQANGIQESDKPNIYLKILTNLALAFEISVNTIINPPPTTPNSKIEKPSYLSSIMESTSYPPKKVKPEFQYTPKVGDQNSSTITPLEMPKPTKSDVY